MSYATKAWANGAGGGTPLNDVGLNDWEARIAAGIGSAAGGLTPPAVKTANYTAAPGDLIPVDTTSGSVTVTLPSAPADKTRIAVKHVTQGGLNTVTIACGGSDVLNKTSGATSATLSLLNQAIQVQYKATGGIWYVVADDLPLTALTARQSHNTSQPMTNPSMAAPTVVCGADPVDHRFFGYNQFQGLQQLESPGGNWSAAKTLPTNVTFTNKLKVVRFGAKIFLLGWNTSTSRFEVYSASPVANPGTFTWSSLLLTLAANATLIPTAMTATSTSILVGEYNGGSTISGGPSVYRSTDGVTFTRVLQLSTTRHIHAIAEDPFNLGTVYCTVGDTGSPHFLYKSTDGGATWAAVTSLDGSGNNYWQAVAMGFTADWIWFASDQSAGGGAFLCDRATMTPRWATTKPRPDRIAVPGGTGGRVITDFGSNGNNQISSPAQAQFSAAKDVGRVVQGSDSFQPGLFILSVTNATTAVVSQNAVNSVSGQTATICSDTFYANAYQGATDPATGWFYVVANDTSQAGTVGGIFVLTGPDQPYVLLHPFFQSAESDQVFIQDGYIFINKFWFPLPTKI